MPYNPIINQRHSIRLPYFDYSEDVQYFITICSHEKKYIFGRVENNISILNNLGKIVEDESLNLQKKYSNIKINEYVIMPNHLHVIIQIGKLGIGAIHEYFDSVHKPGVGAIHESPLQLIARRKMLLSKIVGFLKMNSSKRINILRQTPGVPVWQRNYYEHIIRDDDDYFRIVNYIKSNPEKWQFDRNFRK